MIQYKCSHKTKLIISIKQRLRKKLIILQKINIEPTCQEFWQVQKYKIRILRKRIYLEQSINK